MADDNMFPSWLSVNDSSNDTFGGALSLPMLITVPAQMLCMISLVFVLFALNVEQIMNLANRRVEIPAWITKLRQHVSAWRLCGGYGLFANMTTDRREIIVEGSADGENWLEYSLPYKVHLKYRECPSLPLLYLSFYSCIPLIVFHCLVFPTVAKRSFSRHDMDMARPYASSRLEDVVSAVSPESSMV